MTSQQLRANVRTNLVFYRRNRLVVLVGVVAGLLLAITVVTMASSQSQRFDLVRQLVMSVEGFCFVFAAFLGLVSISHHVRNRSFKLVVTQPCSVGTWVTSHLVSALLVIVALHLAALAGAVTLLAVWKIPFQWGLVASLGLSLCSCLIGFTFLQLLATLVHPVVAAMVALAFNPSALHQLVTMVEVPRRTAPPGLPRVLYGALSWFLAAAYHVLPEYTPFAAELAQQSASWRVSKLDLPYLVLNGLYAPMVAALCIVLTIVVLERKRLI